MATRKKIPLITEDATLNIAAGLTLDISGADVGIVGSGTATITFPSATSTLATLTGTETLTNKTLTSPVIGAIVNTGTLTLPTTTGTVALTSDITGTNSNTNTGDQTTIVGITGTKAQFDTAVTDGNITYDGDAPTAHATSHEDGGADEISIAGLLGTPAALSTHESDTTTHGATGDIVGTTDTQTLTNKRITSRTGTVASSGTPTINTDNYDIFTITALATAITSMTTNLSGTPTNGQKLIIRILDNGTARAITWGASFVSRGATLPTTTVISKYLYVGLIYNSTASKWDCIAVASE